MCGNTHRIPLKQSGIRWPMGQLLFLILFLSCQLATARVSPKHQSTINYAQVLFEFDAVPNASFYIFELKKLNSNIIIAGDTCLHPYYLHHKLLAFNQSYVWKVVAYSDSKKKLSSSAFYQFYIKGSPRTDTLFSKIEITKSSPEKILDGLIMMDNNLIIDRHGNIAMAVENTITNIRDFTLNDDGNFTFLDSTFFAEIDNSGKVLWKSPFINNDSMVITDYHHDMHKTRNGNYLCCALVKYKKIKQQVKYCCLIELNKKNEVVWFWSERGLYPNDSNAFKASHLNSLFFDEDEGKVYCSNRDLSSMTKIDKATGNVEYSFGYNANDSVIFFDHHLFKKQHRIVKLNNGNFLLFNNDSGDASNTKSSIMEITDPELEGGQSRVVWQYVFDFPEPLENYIPRMGGATVLPNDNILVACGVLDKNFEITRQGELVWEAHISKWNATVKNWSAIACYRNNYISSLYPVYGVLYTHTRHHKSTQVLVNAGTESGKFTVTLNGKRKTVSLKPNESIVLSEGSNPNAIQILRKERLK